MITEVCDTSCAAAFAAASVFIDAEKNHFHRTTNIGHRSQHTISVLP